MNEHFFLLEDSLNSLQHALLSEKLHANLYAPLRFYTLIIYRTAQAQNKEVGIFPHPFRGNPDRGSKKHRIFAPEKRNMKYNNLKIYDYETNDNSSGSHVHDDIHYRFCNEL